MSNDGADRRKARIDALADHIREAGRDGIRISQAVVWAKRNHGLTSDTARGYIATLQESGEIVLGNGQRLRHIDVFPSKPVTP